MVRREIFKGPWKVLGTNSLQGHPRLNPGELLIHSSGNTILNCPACNAMQFTVAKVYNPEALPSLSEPVHCGAGRCKKCGVWFTVTSGETVLVDEPKPRPRGEHITPAMRKAGVHEPPILEEEIEKVRKGG